jgi:flagellar hook-associated protein 1
MLSFETGLSALRAMQTAMQVVGQNVANADTEGYTRQTTVLESIPPPTTGPGKNIGRGVEVDRIRREADELLTGRLRTEASVEGRLEALAGRLAEIEALFAEPGDASLGTALNEFFDIMSQLSADVGDPTLRSQAILAAESLAQNFSTLAGRLEATQRDVRPEMEAQIGDINEATAAVAALNDKIVEAQQKGDTVNELRDRRDQLIRGISRLLDVKTVNDPSGSISLLAEGRLLVAGDRSYDLEVAPDDGGYAALQVVGTDDKFTPTGGFLSGLAEIESNIIPDTLERLDTLAVHLAWEINVAHARGVGLDGSFTSLESAYSLDLDRPLAEAGLAVVPEAGALYVSVTRTSTGEVVQSRIDVDPVRQGIRDFSSALDSLDGIRATYDTSGRLQIRAQPGYTFDFSDRVDPNPGNLGGSTVSLSGRYGEAGNASVTLRAAGSGTIGVTAGLDIEVLNADGSVQSTLEVGLGYAPGDPINLASGLVVRFGSGPVTAGDQLAVDLVSDPDAGGVLAALGINALFTGGSAAEMGVSDALKENSELLATGRGGSSGDNAVIRDILTLRDERYDALSGTTVGEYYGLLIGGVGQERRTVKTLQENESGLMLALEARREEVAGVSVDEELVNLLRYQRGFEAAARFLTTISQVSELLVSLR